MSYQPQKIEPKWQNYWLSQETFRTLGPDCGKPKFYVLDMFPYPSSSGLHVGHPEGYTATDIIARYKRAKGFNVLHPMGWDAFGLPAEQYALQTGVHPAITTGKAIETFRRQLQAIGFSYDWSREISTCDPSYYKWTQYLFLKLYERGLAYQKEVPVNWCPALKTVLANEEVVDGKSERGGHPVFRVPMKQWMLKITDYAERLLKDLDTLDWPEGTKELQRNWIGRSEGLQAKFLVEGPEGLSFEIFTTRPDTLFGVTYMVLAPEHPLVPKLTSNDQKQTIETYQKQSAQLSEIARQDQSKSKTGAFTGSYAIHPLTKKRIPIWIADYVLMGYGTGAIMAVPAHDERDFEFAKTFSLPITKVIQPPSDFVGEVFSGEGVAVSSDFISGMPTAEAKAAVLARAQTEGWGTLKVQYKLRDWLFSRQRYWGEPFPILHLEDGTKQSVAEDALPVVLPAVESYEPTGTGESPLGAIYEWLWVQDPKTGQKMKRETDTMPGSAGSSWYFLRFVDPTNEKAPWDAAAEKYFMPVDLYLGGPEHAVGHLLYARFWTKVLYDAGLCSHSEPFQKLVHQGMILGEDGEKMSKSRGNVINPDHVIEKYGADTLRLYEMFMGPLDRDKPWSMAAIEGVYRFTQRVWRLFFEENDESELDRLLVDSSEPEISDLKMLHKTIKKVTEDIESLRFNTAISQMMIFVNHLTKQNRRPRKILEPFVQLLQPFTPHLAEELWSRLGRRESLSYFPWPSFDPELSQDDLVTVAIQVMGKTRGTIEVAPDTAQELIEKLARGVPAVASQLEGKQVARVIYVKNKIINFVAKG
jgi:leucyl-tRNA synthetase